MEENTKQIEKRHVVKALDKLARTNPNSSFIHIENPGDAIGVSPIVSFKVQSDPISVVGVNGCQVVDMLEYVKCLFESLDEVFPCEENKATITKIQEAIYYQRMRTEDRVSRSVEGYNKL